MRFKTIIFFLFITFQFSFSQDTIPKPKQSVVALDKMNVVYRGIENPISIAVNNAKSYRIYGRDVKQHDDGKYFIIPGIGLETIVYIEITKHDNSIVTEEHVFKIKSIPNPKVTINGHYTTNRTSLEFNINEIKDAIIEVKIIDFLYLNNLEVSQFNLKVGTNPTMVITGNKINIEAFNLIKKEKDIIIISDIKFKNYGFNGCFKIPSPITFKIIK